MTHVLIKANPGKDGIANPLAKFDGEYPLDLGFFTNRELHTIKKISGLRAGEIDEAINASDNDVVVAFAVVAVGRGGKQISADLIWDANVGEVAIVVDEDDEEAAEEADDSVHP